LLNKAVFAADDYQVQGIRAMPELSQTDDQSWARMNDMITTWLEERQELIVLYCAVSGVHTQVNSSPTKIQRLKRFCEILVDYCSAGHFEVYAHLLKEAEDAHSSNLEQANAILPRIQDTTEAALDFNDRYITEELTEEMLAPLVKHLSKLGEALVLRFELEDRLIELLHNSEEAANSATA
jgi:regulator of sigma D